MTDTEQRLLDFAFEMYYANKDFAEQIASLKNENELLCKTKAELTDQNRKLETQIKTFESSGRKEWRFDTPPPSTVPFVAMFEVHPDCETDFFIDGKTYKAGDKGKSIFTTNELFTAHNMLVCVSWRLLTDDLE